MNKIEEAKDILLSFGLPPPQQNERSALTLLALCNIRKRDSWSKARQISMSVVGNKNNPKYEGIMRFIAKNYNKNYAENSRETFRRQTLHQFVHAGIIDHNPENPALPTNSKNNHYRISEEALKVVRSYGKPAWKKELTNFKKKIGTLQTKYMRERNIKMIPLELVDGGKLFFSPGKHNEVQIAIIKEFAPRFAHGSKLLYVGDTAKKDLYIDSVRLKKLGIPIDQHKKLPDVMLYDQKRKWLFLIEVVTSHGPMSPKRIIELEGLLVNSKASRIYITAFPDLKEFKKHTSNIAWETEVWIAEKALYSHMIHFNGDRFIGPK